MFSSSSPSIATYVPRPSHDATSPSDAALMARVADGDSNAFAEIYRRHERGALCQARKLGAHQQLAEEVTQDAFLCLWRSAHSYRPGLGSVSTWLSRIVRNRAIDAWRRAACRPAEVHAHDEELEPRGAIATDAPDVDRDAMLSIIAELPFHQREAVFLSYFGGMTHREIADQAGVPLGTVKGRIRLGVQKLRDAFPDQVPSPQPPPCRHLHVVPDEQWPPPLRLVPDLDSVDVHERPAA